MSEEHDTLREFAEDVIRQFGYWAGKPVGGFTAGGLSTLEWAFEIVGWDDPHPDEYARCDEPGCFEQANCGWPTRPGGTGLNGGYRRTCGLHMRRLDASLVSEPEEGA